MKMGSVAFPEKVSSHISSLSFAMYPDILKHVMQYIQGRNCLYANTQVRNEILSN